MKSIVSGAAPPAARMAAARGLLPLSQGELLEALICLRGDTDQAIAQAAQATLDSQTPEDLLNVARATDATPSVLAYLASGSNSARDLYEAVTTHANTPDTAIASLASATADGSLLELISMNQQRLIRAPEIIEAVLANAARTPEAERRVKEIRREFFEKERGAKQIAGELRAQGNIAAAEFFESAELQPIDGALSIDDAWLLAQHLEVSDEDIDDSWLARELIEEMMVETAEQAAANAQAVVNAERVDLGEIAPERISLVRRIMFMTVKDRVKFALKGDRETRGILVRDSNKVVATAVIHNPRITDKEIENIAAMRTVSEEVLRLIGMNRAWTRSYTIIHNLARNPRTPMATAMNVLPRIQPKDLKALSDNRNISEGVRRQAYRLVQTRAGK
ncbi:MAG TPA: hypothetical protein VN696_14115 [Pyrinomonadaceae bacterium]|nr:hypothetical protein [Pyrinomonadaceae bacterium]